MHELSYCPTERQGLIMVKAESLGQNRRPEGSYRCPVDLDKARSCHDRETATKVLRGNPAPDPKIWVTTAAELPVQLVALFRKHVALIHARPASRVPAL